MKKVFLCMVLLLISTVIGCSADKDRRVEADNNSNPTTNKKADPAADNTGRNERDRDAQNLTPVDQKENSTDLEITQQIRQGVMADDALSTNAKNVKIISTNKSVTLRGVVKNTDEKNKVEAIAKKIAGANNVTSYLEITGS